MDTQENKYDSTGDTDESYPPSMSERMHKDAMRYRKMLKFFLDDLGCHGLRTERRSALRRTATDLDNYLDNLNLKSTSILTPASYYSARIEDIGETNSQ